MANKYGSPSKSEHTGNIGHVDKATFKILTITNGADWMAIGKQQWGTKAETSSTWTIVTFPVAFASACYGIVTTTYQEKGGSSASPTLSQTKTNFKCFQDYRVNWFAIGKQQWGRNNVSSTQFPVAFSVLFVMAFGYESWSTATYENYPWVTRSTTGFSAPTYKSAYLSWWALGKQQWGARTDVGNTAGTRSIAFPIAYTSICYAVIKGIIGKDSTSNIVYRIAATTIGTPTTSGFNTYLSTSGNSGGIYYISLGVQNSNGVKYPGVLE